MQYENTIYDEFEDKNKNFYEDMKEKSPKCSSRLNMQSSSSKKVVAAKGLLLVILVLLLVALTASVAYALHQNAQLKSEMASHETSLQESAAFSSMLESAWKNISLEVMTYKQLIDDMEDRIQRLQNFSNPMQGTRGEKGERGEVGRPGVVGPPGQKGEKGATGPSGAPALSVGGVTYNRWGNTSCRSGATRLYTGRTGVSRENHGGGGNYICMPNNPEYSLPFRSGVQGLSYVYGTEYEQIVTSSVQLQNNAACAVCYVATHNAVLMIPARSSCPDGWTREYYGYLMAERIEHDSRSTYACVDSSMEAVPGSAGHTDGGHFYHVEAHCNGVPCPPYNNYKELNCVVCSK